MAKQKELVLTHPVPKQKPKTYKRWTVVAVVQGKGNPSKAYKIAKRGSGEWRCNCATPPGIPCHHLREAFSKGKKIAHGRMDPISTLMVTEPRAF